MKNCPQDCGNTTEEKHCDKKGCHWYVCFACEIAFDINHIERKMPWKRNAKRNQK